MLAVSKAVERNVIAGTNWFPLDAGLRHSLLAISHMLGESKGGEEMADYCHCGRTQDMLCFKLVPPPFILS